MTVVARESADRTRPEPGRSGRLEPADRSERGERGDDDPAIVWVDLTTAPASTSARTDAAAGAPGPRTPAPARPRRHRGLVALGIVATMTIAGLLARQVAVDLPSNTGAAPSSTGAAGSPAPAELTARGNDTVTVAAAAGPACALVLAGFAGRRATIDNLRQDLAILIQQSDDLVGPVGATGSPASPTRPAPAAPATPPAATASAASAAAGGSDIDQARLFHANTRTCSTASAACAATVTTAEDVVGMTNALLDETVQLRVRIANDRAGPRTTVDRELSGSVARATSIANDATDRADRVTSQLQSCAASN